MLLQCFIFIKIQPKKEDFSYSAATSIHDPCQLVICTSNQSPTRREMSISLLQRVRLSPQHLGSELSELGLNSLPALWIARDGAVGRKTTSEQSQLATDEKATEREQSVSSEITQSRRFQEGCKIRDRLYCSHHVSKCFFLMLRKRSFRIRVGRARPSSRTASASLKLHTCGLLGCAEGLEHGRSVRAHFVG